MPRARAAEVHSRSRESDARQTKAALMVRGTPIAAYPMATALRADHADFMRLDRGAQEDLCR